MADDDDDRDSDEGEPAPKKAEPKKAAKSEPKEPLTDADRVLVELKEIRAALTDAREQQARYLWILFPILAILLIQTILQATKL